MIGSILGDIAGSVYEFHNIKTKEFPFLTPQKGYTDDSILTLATADCLLCHPLPVSAGRLRRTFP